LSGDGNTKRHYDSDPIDLNSDLVRLRVGACVVVVVVAVVLLLAARLPPLARTLRYEQRDLVVVALRACVDPDAVEPLARNIKVADRPIQLYQRSASNVSRKV